MKFKHYLIGALALTMFACGGNTEKTDSTENDGANTEETTSNDSEGKKYMSFGELINEEGYISSVELMDKMQTSDSIDVKVKGTIDAVCQVKGCWMDVDAGGENETFTVKFKDYGFFVPKDAMGKEAIMEGVAFMDTVDVELLRHLAMDGGMSEDSAIATITEPRVTVGFLAKGVLIEEYEMAKDEETSEDESMEEEGEENGTGE